MTLRVAMVGCGYFGQFHLNAWARLPEVTLVGIVESSEARRAELANLHPEVETFPDIITLMAEGAVDLLDVTTPPATHDAIIRPLLGEIKTIICQKPFCKDLAEAEALSRDADASGTLLIVHENFRFMPWYRKIADLIEAGTLGTIRQAHFKLRPGDGGGKDAYLARQPYFRDMKQFLIHETGIHWIDTFRYLFGEPSAAYADIWRTNPIIAGEDSGLLILTFGEDMRVTFDGNRTLDHAADNPRLTMGEFWVEGSEATITLDGFGTLNLRKRRENNTQPIPYDLNDTDFGGDCVFLFQRHVVDHLLQDDALETKATDYVKNIRIEHAVYRSADEGRRIALENRHQTSATKGH
ncbi:MAG: Gfo/Idh/MocA family oxidoreductase [Pseudomonadota bacterium]